MMKTVYVKAEEYSAEEYTDYTDSIGYGHRGGDDSGRKDGPVGTRLAVAAVCRQSVPLCSVLRSKSGSFAYWELVPTGVTV